MNVATKLLEAIFNNPRDWRITELLTVARQYGLAVRNAGGNHPVFSHDAVPLTLSVPAHRPRQARVYKAIRGLGKSSKGVSGMSAVELVPRITPPWPFEAYAHIVSPLPEADGGGYLITLPDLPGCMADGETEAQAVENGRDAFISVVSALTDMGRDIPAPSFTPEDATAPDVSGKFVARVPKSIHAKLTARAKAEGVSLNTLVLTMIAEGLGRRAGHT